MKNLFFLVALAACFVLVSCNSKPKPTGDVKKDAKVYMEYQIKSAKKLVKAAEKEDTETIREISTDLEAVNKEFEKYAKENKDKYPFVKEVYELEKEFDVLDGLVDELNEISKDSDNKLKKALDKAINKLYR